MKTRITTSKLTVLVSALVALLMILFGAALPLPPVKAVSNASALDRNFNPALITSRLALPAVLSAGDLDLSFDGDGLVTTDFAGSGDSVHAVAVQSDGKIVAAGSAIGSSTSTDFALARYNSDGSLDTSFGVGGKVTTDFAGLLDVGQDVALQTKGKIVVAGWTGTLPNNTDFALARYNSDGNLDTTFGMGGKVVTDLAGADFGNGVVVQSDGKIVVAGYSDGGTALARYNSDGDLDTTFGIGGKVTTGSPNNITVRRVALQGNQIIVVGCASTDFALARYNGDGRLDATFGVGGKVTTDFGGHDSGDDLVVFGSKIVVAGWTFRIFPGGTQVRHNFALAGYDSNGNLDTTFGASGRVVTRFVNSSLGRAVARQPDGKLVVAGVVGPDNGYLIPGQFALARYHSNGSPDTTFGNAGQVITDFPGSNHDEARDLVLQSNGKIVAAGFAYPPNNSYSDFALACYSPQ